MARPLLKKDQNGVPYSRPAAVETAIEIAMLQDCSRLQQRASERNRHVPEFLPSECLVFLIREAWRRRDEPVMNALLPPLLARCEAILRSKIPDGDLPNAAEIRETVLGDFSELFVEDGSSSDPNRLDFFECRFNLAFRTFRITRVRSELARTAHSANLTPLPTEDDDFDQSSEDDIYSRLSPAFRIPPTQINDLVRNRLLQAINKLPTEERKAVVLCHLLGVKVESEDPAEKTAATLCGVTGRTIRNRLRQAASRLSGFIEER